MSNAPTVMTSSADPGVPMLADEKLLPAAMKSAIPERTISLAYRLTLSSSEEVHSIGPGPPRLIEAARMLNW